jgi:ATP-dependent Clp protease ATP-binding subunit ClpB
MTPAAVELIATLGYDPAFGARPLKRVIQKHLLDPLAMKLLNGEIREGETVTIDARDHEFTFSGALSDAQVVA